MFMPGNLDFPWVVAVFVRCPRSDNGLGEDRRPGRRNQRGFRGRLAGAFMDTDSG
jgi:hypothetical protein